jgi:outer membrane protein
MIHPSGFRRVCTAGAAFFLLFSLGPTCSAAAADAPGSGLGLQEALDLTLAQQPAIHLQELQVQAAEGALMGAAGAFDFQLRTDGSWARQHDPLLPVTGRPFDSVQSDVAAYTASTDKRFRFGLGVSLSADMNWLQTTPASASSPAAHRGTLALNAVMPLLRGRGASATGARERAAGRDLAAAHQDLEQASAGSVLRTALTYWQYVAAVRNVEIAGTSEARARALLGEMRVLIQADKRPASDARQFAANLAERTSTRIQLEQALREARKAVGLAAGLMASRIETLPPPADSFPTLAATEPTAPAATPLVQLALARRADLKAARARVDSSRALRAGARNGVQPQLDASASFGYAGIESGQGLGPYFSAYDRNRAGPNMAAAFTFSWPVRGRAARGLLAQATAGEDQAETQVQDLERTIEAEVRVAVARVQSTAERLVAAREASLGYQSAIEDDREKMRLGLGTVTDVMFTEDRVTRSLFAEVAAASEYASALARLRYETGTLVVAAPDGLTVDGTVLGTPPEP